MNKRASFFIVLSLGLSLFSIKHTYAKSPIDLTIVGTVKYADGLGRLPIGIADVLRDELAINYKQALKSAPDFSFVSPAIEAVLKNPHETPGNVSLLTFPVWYTWAEPYKSVPSESLIKIAYSMLESTAIPYQWVAILNEKFDAIAIPDEYYVQVYKSSGVTIPIFVVPQGIYIDEFLEKPLKQASSEPFTFGQTSQLDQRKNPLLLLDAFYAEFKDDPNVRLRLHGSWGNKAYIKLIKKKLRRWKAGNIELVQALFSKEEVLAFFDSLDCLVLLSKGEGFSVTPREALAMGKPCILSDNTAHHTICKSGFVRAVPSAIKEIADYNKNYGVDCCGYAFNCDIEDVRKALRDVYTNYTNYKQKAEQGRAWVQQYTWPNVKKKFLNLVKPQKVILGDRNEITDDYLMTSSKSLYDKYQQLTPTV